MKPIPAEIENGIFRSHSAAMPSVATDIDELCASTGQVDRQPAVRQLSEDRRRYFLSTSNQTYSMRFGLACVEKAFVMIRSTVWALMCLLTLVGCARTVEPSRDVANLVTVYKNESCGCCQVWVKHLEQAGFAVETHNLDNLGPIKERVGIPFGMGSCHTAQVGGYFIEGHVPADDIKRLLRERRDAKGLTVPAMPIGSPGMESPSGQIQPYDVFLVLKDGTSSVYSHHGG